MDDLTEPILCPLCGEEFLPTVEITEDNISRLLVQTGLRAADHVRTVHRDAGVAFLMEKQLMEACD